jgi:DNA-binding NarL/FixJ family response regulator
VVQGIQQTSYLDLVSSELTERQLVILQLISEDRTNTSISELLGYSESTIRQETIKIFAKLQCSGRHEAAQIYREQINPSADNSK